MPPSAGEAWGRETGDLQLFGFHPHLWDEPARRAISRYPRKTIGKRMAAKLKDIRVKLRQRMHESIAGTAEVAAVGGEGIFPIPCGTGQRGETEDVSARRAATLAAST